MSGGLFCNLQICYGKRRTNEISGGKESSLNILIQYYAQSPSQCGKEIKRNKRINTGTKGIELSLFADAMILYVKRKIYCLLCRNLASAVAPWLLATVIKNPSQLRPRMKTCKFIDILHKMLTAC